MSGPSARRRAGFRGVVIQFVADLAQLLKVVGASHAHFVRCIKPNLNKKPVEWNDDVVTKQLRCSGVMEAVRVIAAGFPDRVPHFEIVGRFAMLVPGTDRPSIEREGEKQAATRTLRALGLREGEFVAGTTKMFLKAGVLADLRVMREKKITGNATYMQAHVRGMVARKLFRVLWEEEMERRRREEEERKRREEEERLRREEEERKKREAEEEKRKAEEAKKRAEEEARKKVRSLVITPSSRGGGAQAGRGLRLTLTLTPTLTLTLTLTLTRSRAARATTRPSRAWTPSRRAL